MMVRLATRKAHELREAVPPRITYMLLLAPYTTLVTSNSFPTRIIRTDWYSSMIAILLKTQISPIWPSISRGHLVFHSGMWVRVFDDDASERKVRFSENH